MNRIFILKKLLSTSVNTQVGLLTLTPITRCGRLTQFFFTRTWLKKSWESFYRRTEKTRTNTDRLRIWIWSPLSDRLCSTSEFFYPHRSSNIVEQSLVFKLGFSSGVTIKYIQFIQSMSGIHSRFFFLSSSHSLCV